MTRKTTKMLHRIGKMMAVSALAAVSFLLPVLVLPWTLDSLEIHKQFLLVIAASAGMLGWVLMQQNQETVQIKTHPLLHVYAVFTCVLFFAALFSIHPYVSFVGHGLQEYTSVLTHLSLLILLFTGLQLPRSLTLRTLHVGFIGSVILITSIITLRFFGFDLVQTWFIGRGIQSLIYVLSLAMLAQFYAITIASSKLSIYERSMRIMGPLLLACSTLLTLSMDRNWLTWTVLLSIAIGLGLSIRYQGVHEKTSLYFVPIVSMCVLVFSLVVPRVLPAIFPTDISPSFSSSLRISTESLDGARWFIGNGPGTYAHMYALHQDAAINQTPFWNIIFDRAANYPLTLLSGIGILGTIVFIVLVLALPLYAIRQLDKKTIQDQLPMIPAIILFGVALFYVPFSMSLITLFVLFLLYTSSIRPTSHSFHITSPLTRVGALTFVIIACFIMVVSLSVSVSKYVSDFSFARAIALAEDGQDTATVLEALDASARFNKQSDLVYRNLAQALLLQVDALAEDESVNEETLRRAIRLTIRAAERSVELGPMRAENWFILARVYAELSPVVEGADMLAIESMEIAAERYPVNPRYQTEIGRLQLSRYDSLGATDSTDNAMDAEREVILREAITSLERATELKSDYAPAGFYLAAALERSGDLKAATDRLIALRDQSPNDVGVLLQLGLVYLRQGSTAEAILELQKATRIAPEYSNAWWYISVAREQRDEYEEAITALKRIQQYDSENALVAQRIERLQEGLVSQNVPAPLVEDASSESES